MPTKQRPNTLWADWLLEAANAAADKNSRAADSYNKAARTLRACPDKLGHPNDALALPGIGRKAVSIISRRLEAWCIENDAAFPRQVPLKEPQAEPSTTNKAKPPRRDNSLSVTITAEEAVWDDASGDTCLVRPKKARVTKPYMPKFRDGAWGILAALYSFCEPTDQKKFNTRETIIDHAQKYCNSMYDAATSTGLKPAWNYGIAVLRRHNLVMAHATLRPTRYALTRQGFELAALIASQEHMPLIELVGEICAAESQLTTAAVVLGSGSNLAANLVKRKPSIDASGSRGVCGQKERQYLALDGNKPKALLSSGATCSTSSRFEGPGASRPCGLLQHPRPRNPIVVSVEVKRAATGALARVDQEPVPPPPSGSLCNLRFQFFYLDQDNRRVKSLREAEVQNGPEDLYKVEFCTRQRLHPFKKNSIVQEAQLDRPMGPEGPTMIGWLRKNKTVPICPGFVEALATGSQPKLTGRAPFAGQLSKNKSASSSRPSSQESLVGSCKSGHLTKSHPDQCVTSGKVFSSNSCSVTRRPSDASVPESTAFEEHGPPHELVKAPSGPRTSFATATTIPDGLAKPRASIGTMNTIARAVEPEIWPAGSYTISLVIDSREVKSQSDRAGFYNACVKNARIINKHEAEEVDVEQRTLAVGDALWIAIHKSDKKEVVLDSIVERKRLDDLCASIIDSRFHEQKARLKGSGLRDRIYLVEAHNVKEHFRQQIQTSKSEMMILDDCHLHETADWKASVEYLVMRTDVLNQLHKNIDLSVIPDRFIDRSNYVHLLTQLRKTKPDRYWVTSYPVFHSLNDKSNNLTINHLWARMINNISGMSAEKVSDFVYRWQSPRVFWEDYKRQKLALEAHDQASSSSAQRNVTSRPIKKQKLSKAVPESWIEEEMAKPHRRIGPALSKKIWNLIDSEVY